MRRRARQATDLRDQKFELEQQVDARTRELTALSTHLQGVSEQEKSALSRELHDELGGLLVAARMDLSWLQQRLPTSDPGIEQRFKRIHDSLSAGVDLKRRVVEELRPTLLDNMGLFTALRWQFKETCRRTGLRCTETIPEIELKFSPDAAIGVFRIAQEALTNILKHSEAKSADLSIVIEGDILLLRITDDGKGIPSGRLASSTTHGLASMRHRIVGLGGVCEIHSPSAGGTVVSANIPLARMLLPDSRRESSDRSPPESRSATVPKDRDRGANPLNASLDELRRFRAALRGASVVAGLVQEMRGAERDSGVLVFRQIVVRQNDDARLLLRGGERAHDSEAGALLEMQVENDHIDRVALDSRECRHLAIRGADQFNIGDLPNGLGQAFSQYL